MLLFARHIAPLVRLNRQLFADMRALQPSSRERHCRKWGHERQYDKAGWFCSNCGETGPRPYLHGYQP